MPVRIQAVFRQYRKTACLALRYQRHGGSSRPKSPERPGVPAGASVPVRVSPWKSVGTMPVRPGGNFGVRRLWACSRFAGVRFISAFKSHVSFMVGSSLHQDQARCPEGSEHRAFGLRMAPGDVAHVPRTPSPVAEAGLVAGHFRSRARLRRLLVRLRRPTLHRPRCGLRQGGFAHYVRLRHYRSSLLAKGK